jgi:hypothetical protein
MDAVARGLVAQYEAALIRERRLADQREVDLIAQYETQIRTLRTQYDAGGEGVLPQLAQARADYAAALTPIAARDPEVRQLVEGYQERLAEDIAEASPEQLAALQRFADGDQEEGFRQYREESERRSAARQRVAQAAVEAAQRADAADARQLASLAETMRLNGRTTTAEVLALWERASELEPTHVESHVNRSLLAQEVGDLARARAAAEAAVAHSSEPLIASTPLSSWRSSQANKGT